MSALTGVIARLEALGHDDVLETADAHSRAYTGTREELPFASHLGLRRMWNFRGVHAPQLLAMLAELEDVKGAEAWRGRLRQLLGSAEGARRDFEAARAGADAAMAAVWSAELSIAKDPRFAAELLDKSATPVTGPAPLLWRAAARIALNESRAGLQALADLDHYHARGGTSPLAPLFRAMVYLQAKDWSRAVKEATVAAQRDPSNCAAYAIAGQALLGAGELENATSAFNRARDRDPDLGTSHLLQGLGVRVDWDDPRAYLAALDAVIAKYPKLAPVYAERAELKRDPRLCEYEGALKDYERAAELDPDTAWIQAVLARAQNYHRGLKAGMPAFDRAIAASPESGWIYAWRGEAWRGLRENDKSLADLDKAAELMPWYSFTHAWRGALLRSLGRAQESETALSAAIRLDPDYLFSWYERFQSRRALADWTGAVADLNHAYALDSKYSWIGRSSRGTPPEGYEPRLAELDAALSARPGDAWLLAWRGYSRLQLGEAVRAAEDLAKASALAPDDAVIRAWTGWALLQAGRAAAARTELDAAVALDERNWFAWSLLADLHAGAEDMAAALAAITRVVELTPTTAAAHFRKAAIEDALGQLEPALLDLNKALELDSRYGAAYLSRALVRQRLGDVPGQIADFKKVLEVAPELLPETERSALAALLQTAVGGS